MSHPQRTARHAEAGSAYIIALLALVVLTIMALGIALITQTEMQVGANERTIQKVFYSADSGLSRQTARALVEAKYDALLFNLKDQEKTLFTVEHEVDVSPFYPIMTAPCNLCEINDAGQYGREPYFKINYGVTAIATRKDDDGNQLAAKTLSSLVEVQPWQLVTAALEPLQDPDALAKIKF
ncbi:MAG TPA: pilus assembly PilX N-terminal domain-containing protein [Thermoanaerobaculia bacterium]|nr:pilus assembly PilX N-terminal domain-containing protein [Thermoanaerobaculia bacterium]